MKHLEEYKECKSHKSYQDIVETVKSRIVWRKLPAENLEVLFCHLLVSHCDIDEFIRLVEKYESTSKGMIEALSFNYNSTEDLFTTVAYTLEYIAGIMLDEARVCKYFEEDSVDYTMIEVLIKTAIKCDETHLESYFYLLQYYELMNRYEHLKPTYDAFIAASVKLANTPSSELSELDSQSKIALVNKKMDRVYAISKELIEKENKIHMITNTKSTLEVVQSLNNEIFDCLTHLNKTYSNRFGYAEMFAFSYYVLLTYLYNHRWIKVKIYKKTLMDEYRQFMLLKYDYEISDDDLEILMNRVKQYDHFEVEYKSNGNASKTIIDLLLLYINGSSDRKAYVLDDSIISGDLKTLYDEQLKLIEFYNTNLSNILLLIASSKDESSKDGH